VWIFAAHILDHIPTYVHKVCNYIMVVSNFTDIFTTTPGQRGEDIYIYVTKSSWYILRFILYTHMIGERTTDHLGLHTNILY